MKRKIKNSSILKDEGFQTIINIEQQLKQGQWYELMIKDEKRTFYKVLGFFEREHKSETFIILRRIGDQTAMVYHKSDLMEYREFIKEQTHMNECDVCFTQVLLAHYTDSDGFDIDIYEFFTSLDYIEKYATKHNLRVKKVERSYLTNADMEIAFLTA